MLTLQQRIDSLAKLGDILQTYLTDYTRQAVGTEAANDLFSGVVQMAGAANGWFTKNNVIQAFEAIIHWLTVNSLQNWTKAYRLPALNNRPKTIGVVMAGNIPMVNFHDFLAVLISGNIFVGKLSSSDMHLLPFVANELIKLEPDWQDFISFTDARFSNPVAIIATGSNNSSRYFDYYFSKYPHIIRRNRSSVAVLHGHESDAQIQALGRDVFSYFGLGCRNVSKVYLPQGFSVSRLIEQFQIHADMIEHQKYHNNYDYQKAIMLISNLPFFDGGFVLLKEDEALHSPVSTIHLSFYNDLKQVHSALLRNAEHIQCVVSSQPMLPIQTIQPGYTQLPALTDYPDGVDILKFLKEL